MARQSRTIDTPAEIGGSMSARALRHLDRMAGFVAESMRIARAAAGMAAGRRWQLPAHASFLKYDHRSETGSFPVRQTRDDGSESRSDDDPSRIRRTMASAVQSTRTFAAGVRALNAAARVSNGITGSEAVTSMARLNGPDGAIDGESRGRRGGHANAWHRRTAGVDAGGRLSRGIRELSLAMGALSRVERSVESGSAALAISTAGGRAAESGMKSLSDFAEQAQRPIEVSQRMVVGNTESSPRSDARRAERAAFAGAGVLASARMGSSIRAVIPPPNFSPREFAEPSGDARGPNNRGVSAGITINSSPTVVISTPTAGSVERDAIAALRAHRAELFNQLKRESVRRERAQF